MAAAETATGKVYLGVVVPTRMREELAELAQRNERTLSGELRVAVTEHLRESSAGEAA